MTSSVEGGSVGERSTCVIASVYTILHNNLSLYTLFSYTFDLVVLPSPALFVILIKRPSDYDVPTDVRRPAAGCSHILQQSPMGSPPGISAMWWSRTLPLTGPFVPCPVYRSKWQRRAEPVMALHDMNCLHAGHRGPNNSIVTDDWKITDFDWCGKVGAVRYLADAAIIPDLGWLAKVRLEGRITMEHSEPMPEFLIGPSCS